MHERHFFAAEKGIRHAAKTRPRCDGAFKANAGAARARLSNLQKPVKLYAQLAIDSARAIDPLFNDSLMTLDVDLAPNEHEELVKARDAALAAMHGFADGLEKRLAEDGGFHADGRSELQLLSQARALAAARCEAGGDARTR